jgi:ribosomal protein S3AE
MVDKVKFIKLAVPMINEEVFVIERPLEQFNNTTLKLDMTRKLRGKGCEIVFQLNTKEDKINIIPKRIHIFGFFIRRLIRAGTDYVEDSFDVKCKDATLKIKPFLITRKKVHNAVRTALRNEAKKEIIEAVKDKTYEEVFVELLQDNFQKVLSKKLKKIYPLSFCDIRDIFVVK